MTIYLDNNATTPPLSEAVDAATEMLGMHWHNPSSIHRPGQLARQKVELARARVASLLRVKPRSIVFTGSGTASIDLAIRSCLAATGQPTILTTAVEHAAVSDLCDHLAARRLATPHHIQLTPDNHTVDLDALAALLNEHQPALVSVQWVNNETGIIQPIPDIARICTRHNTLFHCDATQSIGKLPVPDLPPESMPDLLTCSPHKFHGTKGLGILAVAPDVRLIPTLHGSQELARQGGTENTPAIAAAGIAADAAAAWLADDTPRTHLANLRDALEAALIDRCGAVPNAPADRSLRIWNTTNLAFPGVPAEALLLALSEQGLCASAGAACSSGSMEPSAVLRAIGVPDDLLACSIRLSLSRFTTEAEIDRAIDTITTCVTKLRS